MKSFKDTFCFYNWILLPLEPCFRVQIKRGTGNVSNHLIHTRGNRFGTNEALIRHFQRMSLAT